VSTRSRTAALGSPPPWSTRARYFTAGDLEVDVDPVEQRARDAREVALHAKRPAEP